MKTTKSLRQNGTRPASTHRKRSAERVEKSRRIDPVWIILWVIFILGLLLMIGIFFAVTHPNGGV